MNILLADDQSLIRYAIRTLLQKDYPMLNITECDSLAGVQQVLESGLRYDLMVVPAVLQGESTIPMLSHLMAIKPRQKIACLIDRDSLLHVRALQTIGVAGIIEKDGAPEPLIRGIMCCISGGVCSYKAPKAITSQLRGINKLSGREYEVMLALVSGKRIGEIAREQNIRVNTVSTFKARIMGKLKVQSVVALSTLYRDMRIAAVAL